MAFLGHIILDAGIEVDTQNIEAIKTWPKPMNPTEVHGFLGLVEYYRWFVKVFFLLSAPLTNMT